jgi:hypothetical protein
MPVSTPFACTRPTLWRLSAFLLGFKRYSQSLILIFFLRWEIVSEFGGRRGTCYIVVWILCKFDWTPDTVKSTQILNGFYMQCNITCAESSSHNTMCSVSECVSISLIFFMPSINSLTWGFVKKRNSFQIHILFLSLFKSAFHLRNWRPNYYFEYPSHLKFTKISHLFVLFFVPTQLSF